MCFLSNFISCTSIAVDAMDIAVSNPNLIKRFFNSCKKRTNVLVYGDSGVGKTQFLRMLTGNDSYMAPQRTRELHHFDVVLRSGRRVRFIDTPGHKTNKIVRTNALDGMTKGEIHGIINIVSYGYQDNDEIQKNPDMAFQNGTSIVKLQYLNENRKLEIERTKEIIERVSSNVKLKWFITLINKADVWNKERDQVIAYYEGGEFKASMENLDHVTKVTVCPFCSVITPFGNQDMVLSYGERDKHKDCDKLIKLLEEFINGHHE